MFVNINIYKINLPLCLIHEVAMDTSYAVTFSRLTWPGVSSSKSLIMHGINGWSGEVLNGLPKTNFYNSVELHCSMLVNTIIRFSENNIFKYVIIMIIENKINLEFKKGDKIPFIVWRNRVISVT